MSEDLIRLVQNLGRPPSQRTPSWSMPRSVRACRMRMPSKSDPTTPVIATRAPRARSMVATLLAPPSRSSRRSAWNRMTGASWLMRSASPQT